MPASFAFKPFRERFREIWRATVAVVRLTWRASPRLVCAILALVVLQALLPPLQLALAKLVIDRAARRRIHRRGGQPCGAGRARRALCHAL